MPLAWQICLFAGILPTLPYSGSTAKSKPIEPAINGLVQKICGYKENKERGKERKKKRDEKLGIFFFISLCAGFSSVQLSLFRPNKVK